MKPPTPEPRILNGGSRGGKSIRVRKDCKCTGHGHWIGFNVGSWCARCGGWIIVKANEAADT